MRVFFSHRAQDDIAAIHAYLSARSPSGAKNVADRIRRTVDFIVAFAGGAEATDVKGVRVKWVRGYPFKIFYATTKDAVTILHVRSTSRRVVRSREIQ